MPLLTMTSSLIFLNRKLFMTILEHDMHYSKSRINSKFNSKVVDAIVEAIGSNEFKETLIRSKYFSEMQVFF